MTHLPQDPWMLLSVINTKLRDQFPSLAALCEDLDVEAGELLSVLEKIGYHYDEGQNAFVP